MIALYILLSLPLFYLWCIAPRFTKREEMKPFLKTEFAHRGYHCKTQGIPENSMTAFSLAMEKGYGIELDVHLTKDKQLVVFHDDTLERMCGIPKNIEDLTYTQLQTYQLSS